MTMAAVASDTRIAANVHSPGFVSTWTSFSKRPLGAPSTPNALSDCEPAMRIAAAVVKGVVSQCMSTDTLKNAKMVKPICGNTFKQIMSKLGFENWRVDIAKHLNAEQKTNTMFVGIDVSHDKHVKGVYNPSKGAVPRRSTVGFTATSDNFYNKYHSFVSYQSPDTELITQV